MNTAAPSNVNPGNRNPITYLALGDSYTIGEAVPIQESFPYQAVQLLRQQGWNIAAPEIVATTGWTTDELSAAIKTTQFLPRYNLVTLLIGVNNQYRGRPLQAYKIEFAALLQQAIQFAGGNQQAVVVLSIPDWGATPFAKDRDPKKIGEEIDVFNTVAEAICKENNIAFVNITDGSRAAIHDLSLVAPDGLHPSGKEYIKWAQAVVQVYIKSPLRKKQK